MTTPPKAKRWVNIPKNPPFPIPIGTIGEEIPVYRGRIHGNGVHVSDPEHMLKLYSHGFFGKGMFSKSAPVHSSTSDPAVPVIAGSSKSSVCKVEEDAVVGDDLATVTCATPAVEQMDAEHDTDSEPEPDKPVAVSEDDVPPQDSNILLEASALPESLVLSFVEAFFLSFGLGCLIVQEDPDKKPYNLEELWTRYCELDVNFVPNYVAYHHFRSKGWVPRCGIKFGTNYILYKDGPPFYHASYSVLVRPIDDVTFNPTAGCVSNELDWPTLAGLNRITEQAAKELLFCYVIKPQGLDVTIPTCIAKFKIQETLVKRWVPNEQREPAGQDKTKLKKKPILKKK